jgi:hypothetical protein
LDTRLEPSEKHMAETDKLPRLTEVDGHHAVEIAPGVRLVWWRKGDVWSVKIEATDSGGVDLLDVRREKAMVLLH